VRHVNERPSDAHKAQYFMKWFQQWRRVLFLLFVQSSSTAERRTRELGNDCRTETSRVDVSKSSLIYNIIKIYRRSSLWRAVLRRTTNQVQSSSAFISRLSTSSSRDFRSDHIKTNAHLRQTIIQTYRKRPDWLWGPPSLVFNGFRVLSLG